MTRYILQRLALLPLLMVIYSFVIFVIIHRISISNATRITLLLQRHSGVSLSIVNPFNRREFLP